MFPSHSLQTSTETLIWCPSGKESASNAGDHPPMQMCIQSLGWEGSLEKKMATHSIQYSCLEKLMDRGAWWAIFHGITRVGHDLVTKPPPLVREMQSCCDREPQKDSDVKCIELFLCITSKARGEQPGWTGQLSSQCMSETQALYNLFPSPAPGL